MWLVIQQLETGEEVCVGEFRAKHHAEFWIDENRDNFPESRFFIDRVE